METQTTPPKKPTRDYHSNVDTSRPFNSVKEAVAIFGERLLAGEIFNNYSPKPYTTAYYTPSSSPNPKDEEEGDNDQKEPQGLLVDTLKKLQVELEETKEELKQLKERESETEIALASLNAELHKNMSKLAEAEAVAAKKAVTAATSTREMEFERRDKGVDVVREEERRRELMKRMENNATLAHILSLGEEENLVDGYFGGNNNNRTERVKMVKKKPIIPLVGDLWFFKKKGSSTALHSSLLASSDKIWS